MLYILPTNLVSSLSPKNKNKNKTPAVSPQNSWREAAWGGLNASRVICWLCSCSHAQCREARAPLPQQVAQGPSFCLVCGDWTLVPIPGWMVLSARTPERALLQPAPPRLCVPTEAAVGRGAGTGRREGTASCAGPGVHMGGVQLSA